MARRTGHNGRLIVDSLKELQRGDTVYVTYWSEKYEPTVVTKVKTVDCATIITVKKLKNLKVVRFVSYHTSKIATNGAMQVLTLDNFWGEQIKKTLDDADRRSEIVVKRAEALKALWTLKS